MEDYKHIRTSIMPFGVRHDMQKGEYWYRFSLCIDLNPSFDEAKSYDLRPKYEKFLNCYGKGVESIFSILKKQITVNISDQINGKTEIVSHTSHQYCFNEILDIVSKSWELLLPSEIKVRNKSELPNYSPGFDISVANTTTLFESLDKIPNPQKIRQSAIAAIEETKKKGSLLDFKNTINKEMNSLNEVVDNLSKKLEGITSFAEELNKIQANITLNTSNKNKHLSIYDSVDSILDVWSFIDSNILLQRLMGKTIDFEIPESAFVKFNDKDKFELIFELTDDQKSRLNTLINLEWEHLSTPCKILKSEDLKTIIVREEESIDEIGINVEATNYDVGGKLISLKTIKEKYKDYLTQLDDPTKKESEINLIRKQIMALDTAALTVGITTYNATLNAIIEQEKKLEAAINHLTYLYRIKKGYRVAIRSDKSQELSPIGIRKVVLKGSLSSSIKTLPDELALQNIAINTDSGSHALLMADGNIKTQVIQDQAMFTWSGENIGMPSVFSNQEKEDNLELTIDEGSTSDSFKIVSEQLEKFFVEDYKIKGVKHERDSAKDSHKRSHTVQLNADITNLPIVLEYSIDNIANKKLILGRNYQIVLTPEYKNGWAVPFDKLDNLKKENSYYLEVNNFTFKRNEPVKPVEFFLQEPLVDETGKPEKLREGESLTNLVIRNFSQVDDDKIYMTRQTSVRHILPPAISFQHAFWHHKIFDMPRKESYKWYLKYHFPKEEGEPKRDIDGNILEGQSYTKKDIDEIIEGSTRMKAFYPDKWYVPDGCEKNEIINYLPDPLSKGFRFEFFIDKHRTIKAVDYEKYEQYEFYFSGKYPKINAWKLIVKDYEDGVELLEVGDEEIYLRIDKGHELYITARTILDDDYESQFETFGNYNDFTRYGNNDLLTPPLEFSIVHAVQRPLVRPNFNNILKCDKELGKTILSLTNTANIEQTNIYKSKGGIVRYLEETMPTGNIEIYAKWEEYIDDPKHITSDDWTPNDPVNKIDLKRFKHNVQNGESPATFETSIDVPNQLDNMKNTLNKIADDFNDFKNYAVDLNVKYDTKETKFIEKWLWIKNKSKYTAYYPKDWGIEDESDKNESTSKSKEYFNRLSVKPFLVKILNSKKPDPPVLAYRNIVLVSVIEDWEKVSSFYRKTSMNRLRFFFERGRLTSGKGEKIGFVVNEVESKYNDYLIQNNLVSIVGRDIVSDTVRPYDGLNRNSQVLLTKSNFVTNDPYDLKDYSTGKKTDDLESFYPNYIQELGIMTYLPKFDKKLNLWYLDIEIDINDEKGKELHSPFLRFSMVHYQENSFNYNTKGEYDILKDCRISDIYKSGYAYIMGTRMITIDYGKWYIKPKIQFDITSLKGRPSENLSKFYAVVRHKKSGTTKWEIADKDKAGDRQAFLKLNNFQSTEKDKLNYIKYFNTDYQVIILETEDWGNENDSSLDNLIENKNSRIVLVSTFEI